MRVLVENKLFSAGSKREGACVRGWVGECSVERLHCVGASVGSIAARMQHSAQRQGGPKLTKGARGGWK